MNGARKRKPVTMGIRLTEPLKQELDTICDELGEEPSVIARMALREYFFHYNATQKKVTYREKH